MSYQLAKAFGPLHKPYGEGSHCMRLPTCELICFPAGPCDGGRLPLPCAVLGP